jgi:hypothetical protein
MITYKVTELTDEHPGYPHAIGSFTASNDEMGRIIETALEARGYTVIQQPPAKEESNT